MDGSKIAPDATTEPDDAWRTLVARGLELFASAGRDAFERFCAEHPEAASKLRARLAALERLGWISANGDAGREAPVRIGRYRVVRELGRGGMGVVFLAIDERLDRLVAIKTLPQRVVADVRRRERFVREVRAVAQLRHAGIVPLYEFDDAGETPFFAMEFVEGATLAEALARLRAAHRSAPELTALDLWRALFPDDSPPPADWGRSYSECVARLAMEVAAALAHAHGHGIVHRDVKPSNVLVARDGHARLFDFGLAQRGADDALTRTGEIVGTFLYVAPERLSGDGELDERADVYSLGATLYELATLHPPFEASTTQQLLRQIATRDPKPARALNPQLSADLETVAATALEKDAERRYASAAAMADDLRRVLELRPILARSAGRWTRSVRFARRNPAAAAALALAATLAIVLPTVLFVANQYLRHERDNSEAVLQFLVKLLELADEEELGPDVPARAIVEEGARRLSATPEAIRDVRSRARVQRTLGSVLWMMGSYEQADVLLGEALATQRRELGPRARETAITLNFLGNLRRDQGRANQAVALYREALAAFEASEGGDAEHTVTTMANLARVLSLLGEHEQARALSAAAVQRVDRASAAGRDWSEPSVPVVIQTTFASVLARAGASDEAERAYVRALQLLDGREGDAFERADVLHGLGWLEFDRGNLARAEDYLTRALDEYFAELGPDSMSALITLRLLGVLQLRQGAVEEAAATLACAYDSLRRGAGERHLETALAGNSFARAIAPQNRALAFDVASRSAVALSAPGAEAPAEAAEAWFLVGDLAIGERRYAQAVDALERSVAAFRGTRIPAVSRYADALMALGVARARLGELEAAEICLDEARDVVAATPDVHPAALVAVDAALGECLARAGRYEEAEELLLGALARARDRGIDPTRTIARLIELYERWQRPERVEQWRSELARLRRY